LPTPGTKTRIPSRTRPFRAATRYFLDCLIPQRQPFYHCPGKYQRIQPECEPYRGRTPSVRLGRMVRRRPGGRPKRRSRTRDDSHD
jgi:hypothetical protein